MHCYRRRAEPHSSYCAKCQWSRPLKPSKPVCLADLPTNVDVLLAKPSPEAVLSGAAILDLQFPWAAIGAPRGIR